MTILLIQTVLLQRFHVWKLNRMFRVSVSHLALKLLPLMRELMVIFTKSWLGRLFYLPKRLIFMCFHVSLAFLAHAHAHLLIRMEFHHHFLFN